MMESQRAVSRQFSFEFFPPKTAEGMDKLRATRRQLEQLEPHFFSCTYGAGGSTREGTLATVLEICREGHNAAPHISCVASTRESIREVIEEYRRNGIRHIVALRGDLPSGLASAGEFRYASELVKFIRDATGDWFHIEVACYPEYHPQARRPQNDLQAFKAKVDAGADGAITQYFYNADAYFHFVDQVEAMGVSIPVVPGIMPINNFSQLARFSDACGAEIPRWMRL
jgi:methylenetetrahydrofolate reductase (NADPH)